LSRKAPAIRWERSNEAGCRAADLGGPKSRTKGLTGRGSRSEIVPNEATMNKRKKVGVIAAADELLQLAREYDEDLKESGLADLESWQQEIRDYV
jgi:hypothetical protein